MCTGHILPNKVGKNTTQGEKDGDDQSYYGQYH